MDRSRCRLPEGELSGRSHGEWRMWALRLAFVGGRRQLDHGGSRGRPGRGACGLTQTEMAAARKQRQKGGFHHRVQGSESLNALFCAKGALRDG